MADGESSHTDKGQGVGEIAEQHLKHLEKALYKDYRNGGDRVAGFRRGDLDRDALNGRR